MLDIVTATGTYSPGQNPVLQLKPFFEALYESCGISRPSWLDGR